MRGIRSKLLILPCALPLLAGPRIALANTSHPIVDLSSASSGKCVLGLIDDPEPLPSFFREYQGARVELYVAVPAAARCGNGVRVPIVMWEARSSQGARVVLRYAHDGAWSEPSVFTDHGTGALVAPVASLGTLRLSRGTLREEGTTMPMLRSRRSLAGSSPRATRPTHPEDGPPSVVVSPATGATIVVWSRRSPSGLDLLASEFENGAWTEPRIVAGSPEDERDPQLVAGPDGTVHLLYWVDGATPRVLHRRSSGDLRTWSRPASISGDGEIASRPAGAFHDGILHVTYERHDFGLDRGPTNVALARREGDGWASEVLAVSWSSAPLRPRLHSELGRLRVDWDDGAGADGCVRLHPDGRWDPPRYELRP